MAVYVNLKITRRIKIQDPRPTCILETLEDETTVAYPFDCEELDGSVEATIEDAD
jgi:hypothetical protein